MCIAEVEELVEPGQLDPDEIHLPGIYVQRIIKGNEALAYHYVGVSHILTLFMYVQAPPTRSASSA